MKKEKKKKLDLVLWILGLTAMILLIYGIIKIFNMESELLTWYGSALNFVILIYLILSTFHTPCFSLSQSLIAGFGLLVSLLIHLRNLIK